MLGLCWYNIGRSLHVGTVLVQYWQVSTCWDCVGTILAGLYMLGLCWYNIGRPPQVPPYRRSAPVRLAASPVEVMYRTTH
jgi:hypothetical protein